MKIWTYNLECGHTAENTEKDWPAGTMATHPDMAKSEQNEKCRKLIPVTGRQRRSRTVRSAA